MTKSDRHSDIPSVSIIIPVYNVQNWLERCIASALEQSLQCVELLLVDDGSTDGSQAICLTWAQRDVRLRVIRKQNGGCASARSRGLAEAKGRYVGFVDADDWVHPEMFGALFRAAVEADADIAQCGWSRAFADGTSRKVKPAKGSTAYGLGLRLADKRQAAIGQPTIWRRIYRRDFLLSAGIDFHTQFRRFDDLPFQFETVLKANRIVEVPEHYYFYRLGRDGQDVAIDDDRLYVHFPIFRLMDEIADQDPRGEWHKLLLSARWASHNWAMEKIKEEFHEDYANYAAVDVFGSGLATPAAKLVQLIRNHRKQWPDIFRLYLRYLKCRGSTIPPMTSI